MPERSSAITTPFNARAWMRTYLWTAGIGTGILVVIFVAYHLAESLWLRDHLGTADLFRLHLMRGIGASLAIGTWTFYNVWRMRRRYDAAFLDAYAGLTRAMDERTQALGKAHALTERLFGAIRDRVLVVDPDGTIVKSNRAGNESAAELPANPCPVLGSGCGPDDCAARRSIRSGLPVLGECVRTDPRNGRVYAIDAYPVFGAGGRPELAIELLRDITEARQIEAQLKNQEKLAALGVLAAGIAHDIANPLASMSSELEMLLEERDPARARESAATLLDQVGRIGRTLREMTAFARRRAEESADCTVETAVEDALRMVRHDPRARAVAFHTDLAQGLPRVHVVDDHLTMVLVNLLINSLDAMPTGGSITITARSLGGYVRLSVTDTGVGMSEEVARRATEPLYTTKPGRGTGLGLSISAGVLREAGGALDIDSTPGAGTTIHLTCPAAPAATATFTERSAHA